MNKCVNYTITKGDYWTLFIISALSWIGFFCVYIPGLYTEWYDALLKTNLNVWIPRAGWFISAAFSYIGLWILNKKIKPEQEYSIPTIAILYILGNVLLIGWAGVFFYGHNFTLGILLAAILVIYEFFILLYIAYINIAAAIFGIPLLLMYCYLLFSMLQLENINL